MSVTTAPPRAKPWPPKLRLVAVTWLDLVAKGTLLPVVAVASALRVSYGTAERALERLRDEGIIAWSGYSPPGEGWRIVDAARAAALREEANL